MKTRMGIVVLFGFLFALGSVVGCFGPIGGDGDDDDDATSSPTPNPSVSPGASPTPDPLYGGYASAGVVRVEVQGQSAVVNAFASAAFYDPMKFDAPEVAVAIDECVVSTPGATPPPTTITYRDAGSTAAMSGPANIDMVQFVNGSFVGYQTVELPLPASKIVEGGVYDVQWSGGSGLASGKLTGALLIPSEARMTFPSDFSSPVVLSGAQNVNWTTGSTGSDRFWVLVSSTDANNPNNWASALCTVEDDGAFTIPSNVISQLPAGNGSMGVYRFVDNEPMLPDGSVATVSGIWEHFGPIVKP